MKLTPTGVPAGARIDMLTTWTADAIGGRNLLLGSSAEPTEMDLPERLHYRDIAEDTPLEVGQEYTFSVIVDKLSDDDHRINLSVGTGTGSNYTRDIFHTSGITLGERTIITFTPTEHHLDGRTHFAWRIRNEQNETRIAYREAKLERGPRATPWTPAPEDLEAHVQGGESLAEFPIPFPALDPALTLRVDHSVGTRVFVGDQMIYGDTGWRALTTWDTSGNVSGYPLTDSWAPVEGRDGGIYTRRAGATVHLRIENLNRLSATSAAVWPAQYRVGSGFTSERVESIYGLMTATSFATIIAQSNGQLARPSGALAGSDGPVSVSGSYLTPDPWPTILPGTPV